jgi:tetratricopeptide (TPR) repeat protein
MKHLLSIIAAIGLTSSTIALSHADDKRRPGDKKVPDDKKPAVAAPDISTEKKPWAEGVNQEQTDRANKLFAEGNELYAQQAYPGAAEKYKAAVAVWDHPLIRFNLANSLIRTDKVLEAAEQLEQALRFGNAPFKPELWDQANILQASLKGQVGWLEVSCDQVNAKVLVDGSPVVSCPGTQKIRVLAKEHAINADLKDHLSISKRVVVPGGDTFKERIKLIPLDQAVKLTYKTPRWIPWTVTGVGGSVALAGLLTYFNGRSTMQEFDAGFSQFFQRGASETDLRKEQPLLYEKRQSAQFRGTLGISLMAVGGTAAVGGMVWGLVLNRPYRELPVNIAPNGSGGGSASVTGTF